MFQFDLTDRRMDFFFQKPKLFGVLSSGNLIYDHSFLLKVTSLFSTTSKRKGAKKELQKRSLNVPIAKIFSIFFSNIFGLFMSFY